MAKRERRAWPSEEGGNQAQWEGKKATTGAG